MKAKFKFTEKTIFSDLCHTGTKCQKLNGKIKIFSTGDHLGWKAVLVYTLKFGQKRKIH